MARNAIDGPVRAMHAQILQDGSDAQSAEMRGEHLPQDLPWSSQRMLTSLVQRSYRLR